MEPEIKSEEVKQEVTASTPVESTQSSEAANPQDTNWKKFREQREIERKAKLEADRRAMEKEREVQALKAALEAVVSKPVASKMEDGAELSDEEKLQKIIDEKLAEAERRREKERAAKELQELPKTIRSAYKDYDSVCSQENLDYLEYHHPELYNSIKRQPDSFDKYADAYHAIKRYLPNTSIAKDQAKAQQNMSKPQSISIPTKQATGQQAPMMLDEARRKANWERMQRVMKGG